MNATDTLAADILAIRAATCSDAARIAVRAMEQRDAARDEAFAAQWALSAIKAELLDARAALADLRESLGDAEISHWDDAPEFVVRTALFGIASSGLVYLLAGEWIVNLGHVRDDVGKQYARAWGNWDDTKAAFRDEVNAYYYSERGV